MLSALFSIATSACPSSARAKFRFRICSVRHALACGLPKTQDLLNGHARSVGYQYAANGLLAAITYPDGRSLQYQYDATGQITGLTWAGQAIVRGITWNPLGQPTGWSWSLPGAAAAIPATRNYNSAGQLTATELGSTQYDAAGRIVTLKQKLWRPANTNPQASTISQATTTWNASYDRAGRLASLSKTTAANAPPDTIAFQYDTNGNLLGSQRERAGTSTTRSYSTEAGHNKLLGFEQTSTSSTGSASASVNYQYDSAGNLQTNGLHRYSYDSQGRLQSASTGQGSDAPTTRYAHNALGQRVFKTEALYNTSSNALDEDEEDLGFLQSIAQFFARLWSPKTSDAEHLGWAYLYDDEGSLLGEYGMGGANSGGQGQYFYLPTASGLMPIAAEIDGQLYAIHSDHLNTPRHLTQADGQPAWQWAYSAYGDEAPTLGTNRFTNETTKPTTGSTSIVPVRFNLRYPGQYFDEETGLHYNWHRSYDPRVGRYTQGDPIGLDGGWNRFGYVEGNPLGFADPTGLAMQCKWVGLALICENTRPPVDPELPPPPPITFPNPIKPIINFINSCFPEESCEEKWNEEHKSCQKWAGFGTRWVRACEDRANNRLRLCRGNGGSMPPDAPEPWRPDGSAGGR